jgi:ABC-type transport system involved in cytochrome bd biosynthesis fused ATPase/permease subunit
MAISIGVQTALPGLLAVLPGAVALANLGAGLDPLQIGVLVFAGIGAVETIFAVPGAVTACERRAAAAARLAELANRPHPVSAAGSTPLPDRPEELSVRDLSFRYSSDAPAVLDGLSLRVRVGERIVIVGGSGAGKSTLALLLLRFLSPVGGTIHPDGIDLADAEEDSVRRTLAAATQHAHLFAGTIRENILLARSDASDVELRAVIDDAMLGEWVDRLPKG